MYAGLGVQADFRFFSLFLLDKVFRLVLFVLVSVILVKLTLVNQFYSLLYTISYFINDEKYNIIILGTLHIQEKPQGELSSWQLL